MENQTVARIPPNDTEAERAVLSCMLADAQALSTACEALHADEFYAARHREIFDVMSALYIKGTPVDVITLADALKEKQLFEQIGGADYLSSLVGLFYTSANIKQYIRIIKDKAVLRRLVKAGSEIADMGYAALEKTSVILDKAEAAVFNILRNRQTSDFYHIKQVLTQTVDEIERIAVTGGEVAGVPSGFIDIDSKTTGFKPSNLVLIAARPSMGKSALMLNIAHNAAVRHGITTAIFSLEMSREENASRLLCAEAMVDSQKLRGGGLTAEEWKALAVAVGHISEAPIYIDDTPGITPAEVRAKCRKLKLDKQLGLVIIDYLQLMNTSGRPESRQQEISEISRQLKAIAREIEAPVIVGSQLSRACEQRADHRPMLSDLRESGAIEQDADIVMFIYRDEYYNPDTDKRNQAEIIIAKQRNGPTGTVELSWLANYARFRDLDKMYG